MSRETMLGIALGFAIFAGLVVFGISLLPDPTCGWGRSHPCVWSLGTMG